MPERSWPTAAEIAADVRDNLAAGDDMHALRMLTDGVNRLRYAHTEGRLDEALDKPPTTGDTRWDALLAGAIRYRLHKMRQSAPPWTLKDPLSHFWWPVQAGEGRVAYDMATAPAELTRFGIFLSERDLTSPH